MMADLLEHANDLPEDDHQKVEILGELTDRKKQALHQKRTEIELQQLQIEDRSKLVDALEDTDEDLISPRELWEYIKDYVKAKENPKDPYEFVKKGLDDEIAGIDKQIAFLNKIR
jgi:hypothetical protein